MKHSVYTCFLSDLQSYDEIECQALGMSVMSEINKYNSFSWKACQLNV